MTLEPGECRTIELRLAERNARSTVRRRVRRRVRQRASRRPTHFYEEINPFHSDAEARNVQRQAFAGLLWTKQFYHYNLPRWLHGDPLQPHAAAGAVARP